MAEPLTDEQLLALLRGLVAKTTAPGGGKSGKKTGKKADPHPPLILDPRKNSLVIRLDELKHRVNVVESRMGLMWDIVRNIKHTSNMIGDLAGHAELDVHTLRKEFGEVLADISQLPDDPIRVEVGQHGVRQPDRSSKS